MESRTEICSEILRQFRGRWNVDEVRQMALDQYVSVGDKDTFCQWLETKTRKLGSIKGVYSSKFGIYKRQDESKKPKTLYNDKDYSWLKYYGDDSSEALGQILFYAHQEKDKRPKRLIIAGQYPPNEDEIAFMEYVKKNLNLDFSYESIDFK